jgi:hypothetical protein
MAYLLYNAIVTPDGTILHSYSTHDYRSHVDAITGETYINDGGNDYMRRSVNVVPATDVSLTSDDEHETIREKVFWTSYGKNGDLVGGVRTLIKDMEIDHIRAILETQWHIKGRPIEQVFLNELEYRKGNI